MVIGAFLWHRAEVIVLTATNPHTQTPPPRVHMSTPSTPLEARYAFNLSGPSDSEESDAEGRGVVERWATRARATKRRRSGAEHTSSSVATRMLVEPDLHAVDEASRSAFHDAKESMLLRERAAENQNGAVVTLSEGQSTFVDLVVQQRKSVILMGPPGVGKTMALQALISAFPDQLPDRIVVVLAPTNAMVDRLQEQGIPAETLHHFFNIKPADLESVSMKMVAQMVRDKLQRGDSHPLNSIVSMRKLTIILEEGFMVGTRLFALVEYLLRFFGNPRRIAGGVQLVLTGDPCQMKPVKDGMLFENNQLLCLFDAVIQLKRQHRVQDQGLHAILEHLVTAKTNEEAKLTPGMLKTLESCSAPFTGAEIDPRDQNPFCSLPIVAPHRKTVHELNQRIFDRLGEAMGDASPRIDLPVVSGQVKIDDANFNFRLSKDKKRRVANMEAQYTMPTIRRMALVRITCSGDNTKSGELMRVWDVGPPRKQLATRAEQEAAIQEEAEEHVKAGRRMYFSDFMPVVLVVPANDVEAKPIQVAMTIFQHVVPQYQVQTVASCMSHTFSGKAAHVGSTGVTKGLAARMNPRNSNYPKIWAAMLPVQLGWARTIHSVQGSTLPSLFVEQPDKIWEAGMFFMLLFRVRRVQDLRLGKRLTEAEWDRMLRLDPKAREFLQNLTQSEENPMPFMRVNDVKCVYTSTKYMHDGSVVHLREPRLKQVLMNVALKRTPVSDMLLTQTFDARKAGAATRMNEFFTTKNSKLQGALLRAREEGLQSSTNGSSKTPTGKSTRKSRVAARAKRRRREKRRRSRHSQQSRQAASKRPRVTELTPQSSTSSVDRIALSAVTPVVRQSAKTTSGGVGVVSM